MALFPTSLQSLPTAPHKQLPTLKSHQILTTLYIQLHIFNINSPNVILQASVCDQFFRKHYSSFFPKKDQLSSAMSSDNLDQFPIVSMLTKLTSWVILIEFPGILFDRKKLSSIFSGCQSSSNSYYSIQENTKEVESSTKEEKKNVQTISRGEAELVLKSLGMFCNPDEANLPARLDADELYNMFEEENPRLEEVKNAFDVFDKNGDGFIDANELQSVLCVLGLKEGLDMENCRRMIGAFDVNGDGRIDFHEFVKFMETSFC